jgi:uncharacterized protein (TIGR00725 family)
MKRISVFGGSNPGRKDFEQALQLGRLLGAAGYTVLTGGYIGTMEAVSRGAAESGGHVIGVTCDEIEAWRPVRPNRWVMEEMRFPTIRQRLFGLIESCDAALALPGGPGTLAEIAVMWNHLLTSALAPRPLILIGQGWRVTFNEFFRTLGEYTPENQRRWIAFTADVERAVKMLDKE